MKNFFKKISISSVITALLSLLLLTEIVAFAWLASGWNGGEFSLTTTYTNTPRFEMWTYHKTASDDSNPIGWYKTYNSDTSSVSSDISKDKKIDRICTEDNGAETFTKSGNFSLYFGTINNLVQDQDNVPVYLKFTFELPAYSTNDINFTYSLPTDTDYLKLYQVSGTSSTLISDNDTNKNLVTALNNISNYAFLNLTYFYSDTDDYNLSIESGKMGGSLPEDFTDELFTNTYSDSINISGILNEGSSIKKIYFYFRFNVPTAALQDALMNTELKSYMPVYFIFNTSFSAEIKSTGNNT